MNNDHPAPSTEAYSPSPAVPRVRRMLAANSITTIFVCGIAFDFCVGLTAFDGQMLGFRTIVYA